MLLYQLIKYTGKYDQVSQLKKNAITDFMWQSYVAGFGAFHSCFSHEIAAFLLEPYLDLGNWQWKKIPLKHKALCFSHSTLLS